MIYGIGKATSWYIKPVDGGHVLYMAVTSLKKARTVLRIVDTHFNKHGGQIEILGNIRPCGYELFDKKAKKAFNVEVGLKNPPKELEIC